MTTVRVAARNEASTVIMTAPLPDLTNSVSSTSSLESLNAYSYPTGISLPSTSGDGGVLSMSVVSPEAETLARRAGLALFIVLAVTAIIGFMHWFIRRMIRLREDKETRRKAKIPYTDPDPEKSAVEYMSPFPNNTITVYRASKDVETLDSRSGSASLKSHSISPKPRPISPAISPRSISPQRSNTKGGLMPQRPINRPPPLDEGIPRYDSSSIHSGRSVFYMQTCPSSSSCNSEMRREHGDLDHCPPVSPASPFYPSLPKPNPAHMQDWTRRVAW